MLKFVAAASLVIAAHAKDCAPDQVLFRNRHCLDKGSVGQSCAAIPCKDGLHCVNGVCNNAVAVYIPPTYEPTAAPDDSCDIECGRNNCNCGEFCTPNKRCAGYSQRGQKCSRTWAQCEPDLDCFQGVCQKPGVFFTPEPTPDFAPDVVGGACSTVTPCWITEGCSSSEALDCFERGPSCSCIPSDSLECFDLCAPETEPTPMPGTDCDSVTPCYIREGACVEAFSCYTMDDECNCIPSNSLECNNICDAPQPTPEPAPEPTGVAPQPTPEPAPEPTPFVFTSGDCWGCVASGQVYDASTNSCGDFATGTPIMASSKAQCCTSCRTVRQEYNADTGCCGSTELAICEGPSFKPPNYTGLEC